MEREEISEKFFRAGQVFTPGSPVNTRDLFAGRTDQLLKIRTAIYQAGMHAVLFGERGVGKTSLANIVIQIMEAEGFLVARVNCDGDDSYTSLWRKAFREITFINTRAGVGFLPTDTKELVSIADTLPNGALGPDDVRRALLRLAAHAPVLIVLDEFDRLDDSSRTATLVTDTIKGLSDFSVNASLLLIGVADSVDELIRGHGSIERALVQIPMPRMSSEEIGTILDNGLTRLGMTATEGARRHLIHLTQGVPYIAHQIGLYSSRAALRAGFVEIARDHVDAGISEALDNWNQSIRTAYHEAVKSPQPGNIYREVLLACALAEVDEMGFFTAASVRAPLRSITNRNYDIPNFASHLKQFSEDTRGRILQRVGQSRRLRYRFVSPLMKPYVIMRGYSDHLIR